MTIVRKRIVRYEGEPLPESVIREVEEACKRPIVYDEDCPEESYEYMAEMLEKSKAWREERKRKREAQRQRQTLSLDVLPSTARVAEQYGEGFMARLLDLAVQDESLMQKCL